MALSTKNDMFMPLPPPQRFAMPDLPASDAVLPYWQQIDQTRWYTNFGPLVQRFETRFANVMAAAHHTSRPAHVVAVSSGYHALSIGLRLSGIKEKSHVLIPAVTFPACPLAAQNLGAKVLLADVDPATGVLTPALATAAVRRYAIDAVMPVCLYGRPLDARAWDAFTQETGVPVVIDAAAAVQSQSYMKRGLTTHSLHATKPFGVGEGGLLIAPDEETAVRARRIANFGMKGRIAHEGGENAKMSEYHAAVALAQLDRWEEVVRRRRNVLALYLQALEALFPRLEPFAGLPSAIPSVLMTRLFSRKAAALVPLLFERGVAAHRTYFPPLYEHPFFRALPLINAEGRRKTAQTLREAREFMTSAQALNASVLGLPFHPFMMETDIDRVVDVLSGLFMKASR